MAERRAGEPKSAAMRVKLKYPDVDAFLHKYGPNISRGGIFINTKAPKPVGTSIRFEFVLVHEGAETPVLRGEGVVHFVREPDPSGVGRASGMGLKFTRLLDDGDALIERALRLRGVAPEPPPNPDLPRGVREVTGEVELVTGPVALLDATPEELAVPRDEAAPVPVPVDDPPTPRSGTEIDVDELARESGVSQDRVDAVLRRRLDANADELESLQAPRAAISASKAEAIAALEALLERKR